MLRLDPIEGREPAAEDVVQAAKLARPLDRDEVDRLLHDADERVVTTGVATDPAHLVLRQVSALLAEPDSLLHVLDRRGERERLVRWALKEMEGQPMGRPTSHSG